MKIGVDTLDNGLRVAFVNMPHFRTTSARLIINSGSLHEDQSTAGAAHYLEHITFQGTEDMPTEDKVHEFTEANGLRLNAFTAQTNIRYIIDGYDVRSVGHLLTQLVFHPILGPDTLENERNPIVDELRGYASDPKFYANMAHGRAIRGELYARPVGGSIEDVLKMTSENLTAYHKRNYRLGNAVLVMCSSEPPATQADITESLLSRVADKGLPETTRLSLPDFNPAGQRSSLQLVDLPLEAQSLVGVNYGLPPVDNLPERYTYNLLGSALSRAVHRRLRGELALCYGAQGGTYWLDDLHFGAENHWAHLWLSANLNGKDSIEALDAIRQDVLKRPISDNVFEAIRLGLTRHIDQILEGNPAETANFISHILSSTPQQEIDLEDGLKLAQNIKISKLRALQEEIAEQQPLITATSPDPNVLERIGEWAASLD